MADDILDHLRQAYFNMLATPNMSKFRRNEIQRMIANLANVSDGIKVE